MLLPPPPEAGFISLWLATHLKRENKPWLDVEAELEFQRLADFRHRVSRLRGLYVFGDRESAERALGWSGRHFRTEYLAELYIPHGLHPQTRLDANWITFALQGSHPHDWKQRYWSGEAYPDGDPIWEYLVDQKAYILGTELRARAYDVIERNAPRSLFMLELGRLAAAVGSDLGNVTCYLRTTPSDDQAYGEFVIDMREGNDPAFLAKLDRLAKSGFDINRVALQSGEMVTLDVTVLNFTILKADYPYFGLQTTT
jgi:hypothetical protein